MHRFTPALVIASLLMVRIAPIASAAANDQAPALQEVVVTAQKREEKLQNVPISLEVVGPQQLAAEHVLETGDLQYVVPGLQLNQVNGPRAFGLFIRGIGTSSFSTQSIEPDVAYVVDGVVYGQAGGSVQDFPDVERIEVLRGPQGTLFGKDASAGVVNIITRKPADAFTFEGSGSYAEPYNERIFGALVSGPISASLKYLVSARLNQHDGYLTNVFDGRKFNNRNDYGIRGKMEWTPGDWDVTFAADWFQRHAHCCLPTFLRVANPPAANEALALAAGIVPGLTNQKTNIDGDAINYEDNYGFSVQADRNLGKGYTFTSISAARAWYTLDGFDTDGSPLNLLDVNYADLYQRQLSQELRLSSPVGGIVDYVAGLYAFYQHVDYWGRNRYPTLSFIPYLSFNNRVRASTLNTAAFGQANIHAGEHVTVIAGGRLLEERARAVKNRSDYFNLGPAQYTNAQHTVGGAVWRLGLQYNFDSDNMVFTTITRGFKAGGFDTNPTIVGLPLVKPEIPTNIEAGLRSTWRKARLRFNATVFQETVRDYQVNAQAVNPLTSVSNFFITNTGAARSRGVEVETTWVPLRDIDFSLNASGDYLDAKWLEFPNAPCFAGETATQGCVGGVTNLAGQQLQRAPHWQLDVNGVYGTPLPYTDWKLSLGAGLSYQSAMYVAIYNFPDFAQPSRTLLNTSVSVSNQRWTLSVFVRNLTDKRYFITDGQTTFGTAPQSLSSYPLYEARRFVGGSVDFKY